MSVKKLKNCHKIQLILFIIVKSKNVLEGFNHLYQQYYPAIFRLVFGFVGKEEVSADIVQDVFIKLFTHLQTNAKLDFPKTWIYRVTVNECLNYLARNKRTCLLDEAKTIECDKSDNVESRIIENETRQLLHNAMQRLKMKERMLLTLYSENFSYKEISEISGVKMTSVGKSIARGLEKLRIILENEKDKMSY